MSEISDLQESLDESISAFPVPTLSSLPADVRERIEQVAEKAGFVPNVFVALAHRPAEFRAFFAYHDAVMEREESQLTPAEREMIVVVTSSLNACHYCVVSHGALLRIYSKKPLLADQVAINYRKSEISARERAMLGFAEKVTLRSAEINADDYEILAIHGFDREDVWDIAAISALFGLSNRMANTIDMRPNDEFYLMGRLPREK